MGVMKSHKTLLSLRKPENTSLARSTAFNGYNMDVFFKSLMKVKNKYKLTPDRILNTDETGISTVLKTPKVIALSGQKQVGQVVSGERRTLVTFVVSSSTWCRCLWFKNWLDDGGIISFFTKTY